MGLSDSITDETVLCDIPVSLVLFQQLKHRHFPHPFGCPHPSRSYRILGLCWWPFCTSSYNRNDYYGQVDYQQGAYDYSQQAQYRSANDGYDYNGLNIVQWISMLQDLYEKFDYNDLDC